MTFARETRHNGTPRAGVRSVAATIRDPVCSSPQMKRPGSEAGACFVLRTEPWRRNYFFDDFFFVLFFVVFLAAAMVTSFPG